MHHSLKRSSVVLALCLNACGTRDAPPVTEGDTTAVPARPAASADTGAERQPSPAPPRAATRQDTVIIEGMPELETSSLMSAPAGFALPFSTYVPEGLQTQFTPPSAVRFIAAFAGQVNSAAFMAVHVQDAGAAMIPAATILEDLMRMRSAAEHEAVAIDQPTWAADAIGFRSVGQNGTDYTGSIVVAEHGGRYIHVIRHFPVEYGDGLPPRLHAILDDWRWEDTGAMLVNHDD